MVGNLSVAADKILPKRPGLVMTVHEGIQLEVGFSRSVNSSFNLKAPNMSQISTRESAAPVRLG